ncbi:hypothetical protein WJX81_001938 [Elliptochloris bilobata]|uniref:Peptidase metallopeptidase domain-containing protein n=1 Tax=Elliptochloris bilobata TaxID=381761 RepID=A0AAW1REN9_9CHLO
MDRGASPRGVRTAMLGKQILVLLVAAALCAQLCGAARKLQDDPTLYDASKMTKQQVKDALAYQQLVTGYAALNPVRPLLTEVNCHFQPVYLGASSSSKAAQTYIEWLQQIVSDSNKSPDYAVMAKSDKMKRPTAFNESWSFGLDFLGSCLQDANQTKPLCDFTFDFESRGLGNSRIPRVPAAAQPQVTFKSCGISMNNGITGDNDLNLALDVTKGQMNYSSITNSSSCFIDHDVTHALVYSGYQARSIQRIDFLTTFTDASPDGPPGDYTVSYRCQYTYNALNTNPVGNIVQVPLSGQVLVPFDPIGNALGLDPRDTSWVPNLPGGGLFGPAGNGGNLGKK